MRRLTIKNVGPIKSVTIDLKRINVLIGLQSSGKSTINKIACYCSWIEKIIFSNQAPTDFINGTYFETNLIEFHKLEGFLSSKSFIQFETNLSTFSYNKLNNKFDFKLKEGVKEWDYKRNKTIYIPAERNIVAVIPNWFEIKLDNSNLRNFMSDWQEARNYYTNTSLPILNLGVNYIFNSDKTIDELLINSNKKKINFKNASSGLQSLIPLNILMHYVTEGIYTSQEKNKLVNSLLEINQFEALKNRLKEIIKEEILQKTSKSIKEEVDIKQSIEDEINNQFQDILNNNSLVDKIVEDFTQKFYKKNEKESSLIINDINKHKNIFLIQQSNIFLEEPEVNLFPVTQKDLVKFLVKSTYHNADGREHSLFLTTHSPYILTTLNNLIYANECAKVDKEKVSEILGEEYWVDFNDVGVWFVKDGVVEDILDYEEKQLDATKIDEVSQLLNEEFDNLLNTQYHEV